MDQTEDYEVVWALESRAQELGWHRTRRVVNPRRIMIIFEKDVEPEPGEGRSDPA